mgnify:CR=1 FL=1
MSALKKLNEARKMFHAAKIAKTGNNKFAGYQYFELGDFLVPALQIFESLNLSAVVSFGVEIATMTITDLDMESSQFVITSPMSTAALKACHEVQNLGAVQTYLRRYLWVAALEIVEHDAIDSSEGATPRTTIKGTDGAMGSLTDKQRTFVAKVAAAICTKLGKGDEYAALEEMQTAIASVSRGGGDPQMFKVALWGALDSKTRGTLESLEASERQAA